MFVLTFCSCGEKGTTYSETDFNGEGVFGALPQMSARMSSIVKPAMDKMNEKYKLSMKCFECRKDWFETGKETCNNAEIHFNSSCHDSRCTIFCVNDVNDKLNKNYIESPYEYHYQKVDVLDVKKMLGE